MMMMMISFLILLNTIPLQNKPKIHSVFVCVCMYVKSPPEGDTTFLPDGRRDCELSTSPLPNARRHTIFSMVDCSSSLDYIMYCLAAGCSQLSP